MELKNPPGILGKLEETPVERKTEETAILEGKTKETVEGKFEETVSNAKRDEVEFVGGDQDLFDLGGNDASPTLSPKSLFDNSLSPPNEPPAISEKQSGSNLHQMPFMRGKAPLVKSGNVPTVMRSR